MNLEGFYINLDRSVERRAQIEEQLTRVGANWVKRFSAIDGKTLTRPPDCRLSTGELACFLSHTQIIESAPPDTFTVIFEDDVELSDDLPHVLHPGALDALAHLDIVLLDCQPFWATPTVLAMWRSLERQLIDKSVLRSMAGTRRIRGVDIHPADQMYCWGLQAYMVTPRGHKTLPPLLRETLDRGPPGPIDILIKHAAAEKRINAAVFVPFLATPRLESHVATTMEGRSQSAEKLAIVSAIRRMFFAGPTGALEDYARDLRLPRPATSESVQLLTDLVGQAFAIEAEEGKFVIG